MVKKSEKRTKKTDKDSGKGSKKASMAEVRRGQTKRSGEFRARKKRAEMFSKISKSEKNKEAQLVEVERTIRGHEWVDIDEVYSIWYLKTFVPEFKNAKIVFVPASWDGRKMKKYDIAVDLDANGKGIKGIEDENGNVHSCFSLLTKMFRIPKSDWKALIGIAKVIDHHDAYGKLGNAPHPSISSSDLSTFNALNVALKAYRTKFKDDEKVCEKMFELLDGFHERNLSFQNLPEKIERNSRKVGEILIVEMPNKESVNGYIFDRLKCRASIYVDSQTNTMGINISNAFRKDGFSLGHPSIKRLIEDLGEKVGGGCSPSRWFAHPRGTLICWGSRKDSRPFPSKIKPEDLALGLNKIMENFDRIKPYQKVS